MVDHVTTDNLAVATTSNPFTIDTMIGKRLYTKIYVYTLVPDQTFYSVISSFNKYNEAYNLNPDKFDSLLRNHVNALARVFKREHEWITAADIAPQRIVSAHSFLMNRHNIPTQSSNSTQLETLHEKMTKEFSDLLNRRIIRNLNCSETGSAVVCHMYNNHYNPKLTPNPNTDAYPVIGKVRKNSYAIMDNNNLYELDKVHDAPRLTEINNRLLDKTNNICK